VVVHAGGEAALAGVEDGVGGEGDDVGLGAGVFLADAAGGFEAVHFGHVAIHEDDVEGGLLEGFEGFEAVGDAVGFVPEFLEEKGGDALVDGVVFDDEDAVGVGVGGRWSGGGGCGVVRCAWGGGVVEGADEGGVEVVLADGFDEYAAETEVLDVVVGEGVVEGREEDEGGASGRGVVAEGADEVEAVDAGELLVDEGEVEGLGCEGVGADGGDGFGGVGGEGGGEAPGPGVVLEEACVGGGVYDDEGFAALEAGVMECGQGGGRSGFGEVGGEPEGGAFAGGAAYAAGAVHELDDLFADGEAEAGAAVAAVGG